MLKALDGYPAPGATSVKYSWTGDYFGPASYVQPGETIPASFFGMTGIEFITVSGNSQSGTYTVRPAFAANSAPGETRAPVFSTVQLQWLTAATGAQAGAGTNLSAENVRMMVVGI